MSSGAQDTTRALRNVLIVAFAEDGVSLTDIGKCFEISRQRVQQIVRTAGSAARSRRDIRESGLARQQRAAAKAAADLAKLRESLRAARWVEIRPSYWVNRAGEVYSEYCRRTLKFVKLYPQLGRRDGRASEYIHVLVLEAFDRLRPEGYECDHKNGKTDDNRIENLEWVPAGENNRRRDCRLGREDRAQRIIERLGGGESPYSVAAAESLSYKQVCKIKDGKTFKHLPRPWK